MPEFDLPDEGAPGHEVLRCSRGDETRIYDLRVVPGGAELWRTTEVGGAEAEAVKECHFT